MPGSLQLTPESVATLLDRGFVIEPSRSPEFYKSYLSFGYADDVYFVTTDVAYHYLHLAFSKVLRETEEQRLLPILDELVMGLLDEARAQENELAGTPLAEAASRVSQLYQVAGALLGLDVGTLRPLAAAELNLALEALKMERSPTTSFGECIPIASAAGCVDYSLFKPRGHYTRNEDLERFFRSMSLLGQASFFLSQPESAQLGVLAARTFTPELIEQWELVYEPTAFLVGVADDFTPVEVAAVADQVIPTWRENPQVIADFNEVIEIVDALKATRRVQINEEAAAIRLMGARFVIDSWILDQLVFPFVVRAEGDGRATPSPLDLAAAFGSELAYQVQDEAGETAYENYDEQLAKMQDFVTNRPTAAWAATVYDAWLYALEAMWADHGAAFPDFMRTPAWEAKTLQTALGSYAELKHDTILYAKQSFSAEGDFPPAQFEPRHWVEPDPVAFYRMRAVVSLLQEGLLARELLTAEDNETLDEIGAMLDRFGHIAEDELAGLPISDADNQWLNGIGSLLEALWVRTSDWDPDLGGPSPADEKAALIADIARSSFAYLEIGTGWIDTIRVLVPNDQGEFQVASGGVYSYYEFWQSADEGRLTDEEWRQMLADGEAPARPAWQSVLFAGPALSSEACVGLAATYREVVAEYINSGLPAELDIDENGIPCEAEFPTSSKTFFDSVRWDNPGLFCRDLNERGYSYEQAIAYWLLELAPDRMDADRNGIPCETVYPEGDIKGFFGS